MKSMILNFRSIKVNNVEKPVGNTGYTRMELEYDVQSTREHSVEVKSGRILSDRAWVFSLFLSLMIVSALCALAYGFLVIGLKMNFTQMSIFGKILFFSVFVIIFLILWAVLSIRGALKNIKNMHVFAERGKGNWKIIDEKDWDKFNRLLVIAENRKMKLKEQLK